MPIKIPKLPILYEFILFISLVEVFFYILLTSLGFQVFKLVPYLRLCVLFFTFLFFLLKLRLPLKLLKINIRSGSENTLVLYWILISLIGFIIGLIRLNPVLYLITDFFYIVFGYFLYRIIFLNINKKNIFSRLTNLQEYFFIFFVNLLLFFCLLFNGVLPSFLIIFTMCYSLFLFVEKKKHIALLFLIPFVFQVIYANRALLFVFLILLFFSFILNKISKKNFIFFFLLFLFFFLILFYNIDNILSFFIQNMSDSNKLKHRLVQLYAFFNGTIDWNSPSALSLKHRLVEINLVIDFWTSSFSSFLFGGGLGATVDGSTFKDKGVIASSILGKENIHNIHVLPFSIILRYGFLGVVLVIIFIKFLFKYFNIIIFNKTNNNLLLFLFIFCWILYSIPAASFLWTTPLFWIILSILSHERNSKETY